MRTCQCGWEPFQNDDKMCVCGHKCIKHSSFDGDRSPVAIGGGLCSFCDCRRFTLPTGETLKSHREMHAEWTAQERGEG